MVVVEQKAAKLGLLPALGSLLLMTGVSAADNAGQVQPVGRINHPEIVESSGLAASRQFPNVFWTHNDGARPVLYAIRRDGTALRKFQVTGAVFEDWEDIAVDDQNRLYLGDIGNNKEKRTEVHVYRLDEPNPSKEAPAVAVNSRWLLRYPEKPFDAEGLFIWKDTGYIVSKVRKDRKAEIYRFPLSSAGTSTVLKLVTSVDVESPVTGADLSPDGRMLGLVANWGAFVFEVGGDIQRAGATAPRRIKFKHDSIEGCCFVPDGLLACAESREMFLFESFRAPPK